MENNEGSAAIGLYNKLTAEYPYGTWLLMMLPLTYGAIIFEEYLFVNQKEVLFVVSRLAWLGALSSTTYFSYLWEKEIGGRGASFLHQSPLLVVAVSPWLISNIIISILVLAASAGLSIFLSLRQRTENRREKMKKFWITSRSVRISAVVFFLCFDLSAPSILGMFGLPR